MIRTRHLACFIGLSALSLTGCTTAHSPGLQGLREFDRRLTQSLFPRPPRPPARATATAYAAARPLTLTASADATPPPDTTLPPAPTPPPRAPARPPARPTIAAPAEVKAPGPRQAAPPDAEEVVAPRLNLVGHSESDIRARFGAPTTEEDRTPGKTWRYRQGQCALAVSLYPNVQTKKFTTLAYEVRSDDNSDQGKRQCLAQLQSRGGAR